MAAVPVLARAALDDGSRADPRMLKALALAKLDYVASVFDICAELNSLSSPALSSSMRIARPGTDFGRTTPTYSRGSSTSWRTPRRRSKALWCSTNLRSRKATC